MNPVSTTAMFSGISAGDLLPVVGYLFVYVATMVAPLSITFYVAYFLISLPLRRQARAHILLDLLETALQRGGSVEAQLIAMSETRDRAPGVRFHLLAAHLANGLRLEAALDRVPHLLPPHVNAMLKAGARLGDMRKVLPACRQLTKDGASKIQAGAQHLTVIAIAVTPALLAILMMLLKLVVPKLREVFAGLGEGRVSWPMFDYLSASSGFISLAVALITFGVAFSALLYLGGPRVVGWLRFGAEPVVDWFAWRVPWKRKRMQRDFATLLGLLLDYNVPEADAVQLAAGCVPNSVVRTRAKRTVARLVEGVKLTEAIRELDDTGEFHWRLTNARPAGGGFVRALQGWCDALDAKAFQQEQAATQLATTGLVLFNGAIVAFIAIACFGVLIAILKEGLLW